MKYWEQGPEVRLLHYSQVHLDSLVEDNGRLCSSVAEDFGNVGLAHQRLEDLFRVGRDTDQVDVADGLLETPEATGDFQGGDAWALCLQRVDGPLGGG